MNSVLLPSGFIIPANPNYLPLKDHVSVVNSIFSVNRIDHSAFDKKKLIEENVHTNVKTNEYYKEYIASKSFNSYINIVDSVYSDLNQIPVYIWLKLQLESNMLSPIVKSYLLSFIKDMAAGGNGTVSLHIPYNLRFNPRTTDKNAAVYVKELDDIVKPRDYISSFPSNWKNFITTMHSQKKLLEFFKLVFVDFY